MRKQGLLKAEPSTIPSVKKTQAAIVQGRDHLAQAESNFPVINEAIAKAKATEKPTYPI